MIDKSIRTFLFDLMSLMLVSGRGRVVQTLCILLFSPLLQAFSFILLVDGLSAQGVFQKTIIKFLGIAYADPTYWFGLATAFFFLLTVGIFLGFWGRWKLVLIAKDVEVLTTRKIAAEIIRVIALEPDLSQQLKVPRYFSRCCLIVIPVVPMLFLLVLSTGIMLVIDAIFFLVSMVLILLVLPSYIRILGGAQYSAEVIKHLAKPYTVKVKDRIVRNRGGDEVDDVMQEFGFPLFKAYAERVIVGDRSTLLMGGMMSLYIALAIAYFGNRVSSGDIEIINVVLFLLTARYFYSSLTVIASAYSKLQALFPIFSSYGLITGRH